MRATQRRYVTLFGWVSYPALGDACQRSADALVDSAQPAVSMVGCEIGLDTVSLGSSHSLPFERVCKMDRRQWLGVVGSGVGISLGTAAQAAEDHPAADKARGP